MYDEPQHQQLKKSIMSLLQHCGVPVNKLNLSVSQDQIVLTGSVDTFYALQLIQCQLRMILGERSFINKVSVTRNSSDRCSGDRRLSLTA